ncbi:MAG: hypothetical protein IKH56_00475 [Oscillospiraceae bacterium]|nr:hypothetical protein [Oscillospiraceae bacterium]
MDKQLFFSVTKQVFDGLTETNAVHLPAENVTLPILDAPIIGFAAADDPLFDTFKDPQIIGENWLGPLERMPEAKTVAVFFFPFTEEIRKRHRACREAQNEAWNEGYGGHGKVVGTFARSMTAALNDAGVRVVNPTWAMEHPTTTTPFLTAMKTILNTTFPGPPDMLPLSPDWVPLAFTGTSSQRGAAAAPWSL